MPRSQASHAGSWYGRGCQLFGRRIVAKPHQLDLEADAACGVHVNGDEATIELEELGRVFLGPLGQRNHATEAVERHLEGFAGLDGDLVGDALGAALA